MIQGASAENGNNPKLRAFVERYPALCPPGEGNNGTASQQVHQAPSPQNFDLHVPIRKAHQALIGRRGLVGLAVPCEEARFRRHFCERLREKLGTFEHAVRDPLTIRPIGSSIEEVVDVLGGYRRLLAVGDVICPVQVEVFLQSAGDYTCDRFWQTLSAKFGDECPHRLIVVLMGTRESAFPAGVVNLEEPAFARDDVFDWVSEVIRGKGWPEPLVPEWEGKILAHCGVAGALRIRLVYEHLDEVALFLPRLRSVEQFRAFLAEWSQL